MVFDSDDEFEVYNYKSRQAGRAGNSHIFSKAESASTETDENGHVEPTNTSETDSTSSNEVADQDPPHPFYNYSTEKADSHADAKLIYQRYQMNAKVGGADAGSPTWLTKSITPPMTQTDGADLGRAFSNASHKAASAHSRESTDTVQPVRSREAFPTLEAHVRDIKQQTLQDPYLIADAAARDHQNHPGLPHEFKDALLANQGVHGAGAGVGLGYGANGFAKDEGSIVAEVVAICDKIKTVLDLRLKFMRVSLQCPGDNPKDDDSWNIYPPPPKQVWGENKSLIPPMEEHQTTSASSSLYMTGPQPLTNLANSTMSLEDYDRPLGSPTATKNRKMGKDIGSDFDINECVIPGVEQHGLQFSLNSEGVYQVFDDSVETPIIQAPSLREYYIALDTIQDIASDGPAKSFAYRRLQYLEGRYHLYTLLNEYEEVADTKKVPHRDFYNVRKVDTHVHHSACMNQKHLLRFIKSKMKKCPDEVVIDRDGQRLTLAEVFQSINLSAYDLSIDTLDMHAHKDSFHRFDKFNLKYNPIGQSRLRDIFLKTDNYIKGRYLADITKEVIEDLESSKYQMVEWRLSIYGRDEREWDKLASWVVDNRLFSHNVRWLVQIPRLYNIHKASKTVDNFEEMLRNIFRPLFEVTQDPSKHPKLHIFLQRVIGFDCVDDESKVERRLYRKYPAPREWDTKQNPPYGYWIYFLFANMTSLNHWRRRRGMNTFVLRPHCGEAGDVDHLASAALCCHSISHGITLRKTPLLQYVFYLEQIGIAMSPLSNNALFLTFDRNPFISYFKKGMNVSLSTDDPLQFAFTKEPLIEEYSVAAQIYKLSAVDMCELAKHSVDQCGFELSLKQRWLGKNCYLPGILGNDVAKCNVPDLREAFRHETLKAEHSL